MQNKKILDDWLQNKPRIWGGAVVLFSFLILWTIHGDIMIQPNSYMMSSEGEAIRVHYVMAYHAKYDTTSVNFDGMNYPYGEHIVYTDGQPIFANSFRWMTQLFPGLEDYAVGFQNTFSLYSLILSALLLFFLFRKWNVASWLAVISAVSLMLISPQIIRMPWHHALAYTFIAPSILLLYLNYFRKRTWFSTVWIFLFSTFLYFLNPYHGVFAAGFFGVVFLSMLTKERLRSWSVYAHTAIHVLLPGVVYQVWGALTDTRNDRINLPTGLHEFLASPTTLLTSPYTLFSDYYEWLGVDHIWVMQHFEGMAYIGSFGIVFSLAILIRWIVMKLTKQSARVLTPEQKVLVPFSILFLLFSMGYPFLMSNGMEDLFTTIKPLRQLRALGRFSWLPVLSLNLLGVLFLNHWIKQATKSKKVVLILIGFALLLIQGIEGKGLHEQTRSFQHQGNELLLSEWHEGEVRSGLVKALDNIDLSTYKSIIPLPYYHVGSELFSPEGHSTYYTMFETMTFAYHTGIPLNACYLSRISRVESMNNLQLFAPSIIPKDIAKDFPVGLSLILHVKTSTKLTEAEKRILELSATLYEDDYFRLSEIDPALIWETNNEEVYDWFVSYKDLYEPAADNSFWAGPRGIYHSYNSEASTQTLFGAGAKEFDRQKRQVLFDQNKEKSLSTGKYEMSFWLETSLNRSQSILIAQRYALDGTLINEEKLFNASRSYTFYKGWVQWKTMIDIKENETLKLVIDQPSNRPGIVIDELMVRPLNASCFIQHSDTVWTWNNLPFNVPESH